MNAATKPAAAARVTAPATTVAVDLESALAVLSLRQVLAMAAAS